ncbi:ops-1 [Pristionchus pacificus]|uniref:Ops-1 n=1 Tax=Pristionchus pacificus TaxID=54126 RepID=A0A2A6BY72_PRIPA|nr:ops-1 [Pristionchus pacificus]|eukprot:PDM70757.1 ops-1 [Pristionchus pacificus]
MQLFNLIIVVFCAMAIPLNFVIAFVIFRERMRNKSRDSYFRSSFFDLLLLDPPVLIIFFLFYVIKAEPPISEFLFTSSWNQTAAWSYYCLYLALYWKITGIVLITIQRLCACCYRHRDFTKFLDAHPKAISCICLLISPIITFILWATSPPITFNNVRQMAFVLDQQFVTRNVALAAALITICIVVSSAAYGRIYIVMRRMMQGSGVSENLAMRAQLRMTMQGFAQVCALCFIDVYFLIVTFGTFASSEDVEAMRRFYHAFYFMLSALNPISLIILSDKTREALCCLAVHKKRRQQTLTVKATLT